MAHCGSSTPLTDPDGSLVAVHRWLALMAHCGSSTLLTGPDGSLW